MGKIRAPPDGSARRMWAEEASADARMGEGDTGEPHEWSERTAVSGRTCASHHVRGNLLGMEPQLVSKTSANRVIVFFTHVC